MLCAPSPVPEYRPSSTSGFGFFDEDEDDAALQAVLLASLCQPATEEAPVCDAAQSQQESRLAECAPPPLVSLPIALTTFASEVGLDDEAKATLQELERGSDHLQLCRVRGDGHCLFRGIAASLALAAAWGGHAGVAALHSHFDSLELLRGSSVDRAVQALRALLGRSAADAALVSEALNDAARSDRAVAALRECATAYMREHADRFRFCSADGEDFDEYCQRMEAMSVPENFSPAYGGHSEAVALSEALRIQVEIVDCSGTRAKSTIPTYRLAPSCDREGPKVFLLRRGLHYHLMLPSTAEGESLSTEGESLPLADVAAA